ncbi:MAG TPA: DoxX family protein, partial [Chryseolinea sp.]|nr:DoxX family protein [Chryseolinea sp.]
ALIMAAGGLTKLVGLPQLVELYSKIGLLPYMKLLGISEIILVALFVLPRTMKIGFLLLTGYLGGAMAVELSHGTIFIAPGLILTLIWITAYFRDRSIFIKAGKNSVEIKPSVAI